jgi:hypothetical protein
VPDLARRGGFTNDKRRVPMLRKRLERWRHKHDGGWLEATGTKGREPRTLYRWSAVRFIVEAVRETSIGASTT